MIGTGWVIAAWSMWSGGALDELTWVKFEELFSEVSTRDEAWQSIPWHLDLLSAQQQAVREQKLLFVWAMDGHPVGCT